MNKLNIIVFCGLLCAATTTAHAQSGTTGNLQVNSIANFSATTVKSPEDNEKNQEKNMIFVLQKKK